MSARLLLVDDDADTREIIAQALQRALPEIRLREAASAEEGLAIARHERDHGAPPYDAILTDHRMRFMTGAELIDHARKEDLTRSFVLMSGDAEAEDAFRALGGETRDFLPKPFAMNDLLARVAERTHARA